LLCINDLFDLIKKPTLLNARIRPILIRLTRPIFLVLLGIQITYAQNNSAPVVTAVGDQAYCPGEVVAVVTSFDIVDIDDTEIDEFSIQISEGYQRGNDILRLTGNHPTINTTWNVQEGKLRFRGLNGAAMLYSDLIPAVQAVVFESTSDNPTEEKLFSLTVGSANYLPETDHYYEYVPAVGIAWDDAREAAANRTFFGLQGYLVTITSRAEAQLSGEQAAGTGWIGGSDSQQEGVWRWMTGPEAGIVFWNGGVNGSSPNFAFWNTQEPNNLGDEDYAHITAPGVGIPGSWNDLPLLGGVDDFLPRGYVVEYGGTPGDPVLNLSASTRLTSPKITAVVPAEICGDGTAFVAAEATDGEVIWFDSQEGGAPLGSGTTFETPIFTQSGFLYALASVDGCLEGERIPVEVVVKIQPPINNGVVLTNCDEDGLADGFTDFDFNSYLDLITDDFDDFSITFYLTAQDAQTGTNPLPEDNFNNAQSDEVFFRVEGTGIYCFNTGSFMLDVSTTSFPADFRVELEECDTGDADGITEFDLQQAEQLLLSQFPNGQNLTVSFFTSNTDALLKRNEISNLSNYTNTVPFFETLFVRVDENGSGTCFGVGAHLVLRVYARPSFELQSEYGYCIGESVQITPLNPEGNYQYRWFDSNDALLSDTPEIRIASEGNYGVMATSQDGCISEMLQFTVLASGPPVFSPDVILVDSNAQTITISSTNGELGLGNYEFALDNPLGPFQFETTFTNVEPGLHTIYGVDVNCCGNDAIEVGVIGMPKFFTPNNDLVNDEITVLGLTDDFYQEGDLFVYDRYGMLLAQVNVLEAGWNGLFNGRPLPPSDYWYVLQLVNRNGGVESWNGHFTLKQ